MTWIFFRLNEGGEGRQRGYRAVSVICTDKTETLTRHEMVVLAAETPERTYAIKGEGYVPQGAIMPAGNRSRMARAAALCNDAALREHAGHWTWE